MDVTISSLKERNEPVKNATVKNTPAKNNGHVYAAGELQYKQIGERLDQIGRYLEEEIAYKQKVIQEQRIEIVKLQHEISEKNGVITNLQQQVQQSVQSTEGHRQLINKLLNDIEHYQNDIDWYKRTYERRSIWGVLKQKLTKR